MQIGRLQSTNQWDIREWDKESRDIVTLARFERALPPHTWTSTLEFRNYAEQAIANYRNASCYLRQSSAPGMDQRNL